MRIFNSIKDSVGGVFDWLKETATKALDAILAPVEAIKTAFDRVVDAIRSVIDWLGRLKLPDAVKNIANTINGILDPLSAAALFYGYACVRRRSFRWTVRSSESVSKRSKLRKRMRANRCAGRTRSRRRRATDSPHSAERRAQTKRGGPAMTTGISCVVLVDGVRAQDGSPGDDLSQAVVLENLAVTWGRSDTMTQPDADSCTFDVMDAAGDGFASTFRTGSRIDVLAFGERGGSASEATFTNPSFEDAAQTWSVTSGTATRSAARVSTGAYALAVVPNAPTSTPVLLLAPAPFESAGTNPDAWDDIAQTSLGETWSASVSRLWLSVRRRLAQVLRCAVLRSL